MRDKSHIINWNTSHVFTFITMSSSEDKTAPNRINRIIKRYHGLHDFESESEKQILRPDKLVLLFSSDFLVWSDPLTK